MSNYSFADYFRHDKSHSNGAVLSPAIPLCANVNKSFKRDAHVRTRATAPDRGMKIRISFFKQLLSSIS